MKQLTDELLNEYTQSSPQAFQAIFDSYRMRIYYFVKKLIDDRLTAEEITSDTFVKLYRLLDNFKTVDKIQAFLFITARNASFDFLKHRRRQEHRQEEFQSYESPEIDFPDFGETNIEADVLQFIFIEIEKLPKRSQRIFKLFYLEGKSIRDIAEIMGISQQTVANAKHTALKILRMKVLDRPGLFLWLLCAINRENNSPVS